MTHKCTAGHLGPRFKLYGENTLSLFADVENNVTAFLDLAPPSADP